MLCTATGTDVWGAKVHRTSGIMCASSPYVANSEHVTLSCYIRYAHSYTPVIFPVTVLVSGDEMQQGCAMILRCCMLIAYTLKTLYV